MKARGQSQEKQHKPCELTILLPCLNESETLPQCIEEARQFLLKENIAGEILVADNGSEDSSVQVAHSCGARAISVPEPGYGSALRGGTEAANGTFTIMGDADGSYDFSSLKGFLEELRKGCDLVIGNRFAGGIEPGAMPFLHRYIGNPALSGIGRLFFHSTLHDFHCGLRGFRTEAIRSLHLQTKGMEFASEMIVRASLAGLRVCEVPTVLRKDRRSRGPHLRTLQDGWRHLRFLFLFSPSWLFLYPGIMLVLLGIAGSLWLLPGQQYIFDIHTLLYCAVAIFVGVQAVSFAVITRIYAGKKGFLPPHPLQHRLRNFPLLETGLLLGAAALLGGIVLTVYAFHFWQQRTFGDLNPQSMLRLVIPSVSLIVIGMQIMLNVLLLAILDME